MRRNTNIQIAKNASAGTTHDSTSRSSAAVRDAAELDLVLVELACEIDVHARRDEALRPPSAVGVLYVPRSTPPSTSTLSTLPSASACSNAL